MRTLLLALLAALPLHAMEPQAGSTAIGLSLGAPTGLNFKSWFSPHLGASIDFGGLPRTPSVLYMAGDALYHVHPLYRIPLLLGGGLHMTVDPSSNRPDNYDIGLHAIAGLELFLPARASLYAQGGATLTLLPTARIPSWGWLATAGARYYLTEP